jgi:hypothetical protein
LPRKAAASFFHTDFAIRRDDDTDRFAVDLGHQCLEHATWLDAERVRRLQADAFGAWIIGISMKRKPHAEVAERKRCAGAAGHFSTLLCRVPYREHINSARLFSPDVPPRVPQIRKFPVFGFARGFRSREC